jgi:hypothetical protein
MVAEHGRASAAAWPATGVYEPLIEMLAAPFRATVIRQLL